VSCGGSGRLGRPATAGTGVAYRSYLNPGTARWHPESARSLGSPVPIPARVAAGRQTAYDSDIS